MSKFDEFVDEFVYMAKNAADVATKKTGEVVEIGKLRYQMKQIQWEIEKSYAKLGAVVYESKKNDEDFSEMIGLAMSEIDDLLEKMDELGDKLRSFKRVVKCPSCARENENGAMFCSRCGEPLIKEYPPSEEPAGEPMEEETTGE